MRCRAFIVRPKKVAMRGRRTIGRLRLLPNTALSRSRRSANDGSVADHPLVSFNRLVQQSFHRATVPASIGETVFLSEISITSAGLTVSHFIEAEFAR